jgi:hypothetical protein
MEMIRIAFALIGAATMLAVIVIAIFGRDDDRLNEGLLIGIYVGAFGSISVLFVLRYLGLFWCTRRIRAALDSCGRSASELGPLLAQSRPTQCASNVRFWGNADSDQPLLTNLMSTRPGLALAGATRGRPAPQKTGLRCTRGVRAPPATATEVSPGAYPGCFFE